MKSAAGLSMARVVSWQRCAAPPSCMPQKRSRQRWNSQRPEYMRRHSTSYSMRPLESLTIPCWRPQVGAAAKLPPVKMRIPLNCGTVSVAFTSSAIALMMTGNLATSLLIETNETLGSQSTRSHVCYPVEHSPLAILCCSYELGACSSM